jgi:hypothetical protein
MDTRLERSIAMNGRDLLKDIMEYGHAATHGGVPCNLDMCPRCHGHPVRFRPHGVRNRLFLVFAAEVIRRVFSYLTRWKCPLCNETFTLYPDFAIPFKRYVLVLIFKRCTAYVSDEARTYREGVKKGGESMSYANANRGRMLWASTLWDWVGTLGRLSVTARQALNLIKQKDPSTEIFRALGQLRIREGKYRSEARKRILLCCRALGIVDRVYARLFGKSVFPELATRSGFS